MSTASAVFAVFSFAAWADWVAVEYAKLAATSVSNMIRFVIFIISSFKFGAGWWHWKRRLSSFPPNGFDFPHLKLWLGPGNRSIQPCQNTAYCLVTGLLSF